MQDEMAGSNPGHFYFRRHDPIGLNRIMISPLCLSMISSENRFPLFRIMLYPFICCGS